MLKYADEIRTLEETYFGSSFSSLANFMVEIVEEENILLAYVIYQAVLDEAEIVSIFVKPDYRRKGLASNLLKTIQKKYTSIFLEVNEKNYTAVNLYKKLGFVTYRLRPNYYHNTDTAILMKWSR